MADRRAADVTLRLHESVDIHGLQGFYRLESFVAEAVEPRSDDPGDAGGAGIQVKIHAGTRVIEAQVNADPEVPPVVAWTEDSRVQIVEYDPSVPSIGLAVDRISEVIAGSRTLSLRLHETGDLGGASMRFEGHSHKKPEEGRQSPLLIAVTYEPDAGPAEVYTHVSLNPPERATWRWRNYELRLTDWAYAERIDLDVHRFELVPISPRG